MAKYFINKSVHLCFTADCAIFLDLRSDRYISLDSNSTDVLRRLLIGSDSDSSAESPLASELMREGLLTTDRRLGVPFSPIVSVRPPTALLPEHHHWDPPRCSALDLLKLIVAYIAVRISLCRGVLYATARATRRNARIDGVTSHTRVSTHTSRECQLLQIFFQLRPLLFPSRDECLLNSLVLSEFFAMHALRSQIIFAVKTSPFFAHCWVQRNGFVLNSRPELLGSLMPIMIVE